jgi:5-methylcytosine-specific restriction endonuclease McrA
MQAETSQKVGRKELVCLVESQGYCCALTGWELKPATASLDHILPVSRGGGHSVENLQVLDYRVNKAKGTMTTAEFVSMCHAVARHSPDCGDTTWIDRLVD